MMRAKKKTPIVRQQASTECGLACVAMVMGAHGRNSTPRELRRIVEPGRDGLNLAQLAQLGESQGMDVKGLKGTIDALSELPLPAILHWEESHYVVLERIAKDSYTIVDPAAGRRKISREELAEKWTGRLLVLWPNDSFEARRSSRSELVKFLARYIPVRATPIAALITASALLVMLTLVAPYLSRYVIDNVSLSIDISMLWACSIFVGLYGVCYLLSSITRAELLLWMQTAMDAAMMSNFLKHLVSLPFKYFQTRRGGDLMVRAGSTTYIRDLLSGQLLGVIIDVSMIFIYFVIIGQQSLLMAGILVVVIILQVSISLVTLRWAKRYTQDELIAVSEAQSTLLETINGIESIKSAGVEDQSYDRWEKQYDVQLEASVRRRRLDNGVTSALSTVQSMTPMLFILIGAYLVIQGSFTPGDMVAMSALAGAALAPIGTLGTSIQAFQTISVHLDRVKDILDEEPEEPDEGRTRVSISGDVVIKDADFRYSDGAPLALHGINIHIPAGARVAVVGHSGSGKSTLARLITGLVMPSSGDVTYDDVSLHDISLKSLRQQCGVVTQSPSTLSGTIRQNVALAAPSATEEDVWRALGVAALSDEVRDMPLQLWTPLGDGGAGLSGGQIQRLALARAVIFNPKLLVLDEATSHLDSDTENSVFENIKNIKCTQILVAHRLSTVRDADLIIVLEKGRVVGVGTHSELLEGCEEYLHLVARQLPAVHEG